MNGFLNSIHFVFTNIQQERKMKKIKREKVVVDENGNVLENADKYAKVTYPYGKKHWESCQKRNQLCTR